MPCAINRTAKSKSSIRIASSGLWLPFMFLPHFIQRIAVVLPSYHLSQLALDVVGAGQGHAASEHWQALAGFTLICMGIAWLGHQRDQKANG